MCEREREREWERERRRMRERMRMREKGGGSRSGFIMCIAVLFDSSMCCQAWMRLMLVAFCVCVCMYVCVYWRVLCAELLTLKTHNQTSKNRSEVKGREVMRRRERGREKKRSCRLEIDWMK